MILMLLWVHIVYIPKFVIDISIYMQRMTLADAIYGCVFFIKGKGLMMALGYSWYLETLYKGYLHSSDSV